MEELSLSAQEVRRLNHDAYLCGLFAPEDQRQDFYVLHMFFEETARIRAQVSEPHLGLIRLQWWRDFVQECYAGQINGDVKGLHHEIGVMFSQKQVPEEMLERYFNARQFDMEDIAFDDLAAFHRYGEATGGLAAQMKEGVLGLPPSLAALKVGTAGAYADLLQTAAYSLRHNRCKFPKSLMKKHQVKLDDTDQGLPFLVKELAEEARNLIYEARKEQTSSNAVLLQTVGLEAYFKQLEKVGFDLFSPKIRTSRLKKQLVLGYKAWRNIY
jgi:NADH dehydrogenase [ubiquinone] 1 alpha subcomplex assembly factor 6